MTLEAMEEVLDVLTWMDLAMADQEAENKSEERIGLEK